MISLAAELATAPCIRVGVAMFCTDERRKHPECQAAHLEALRRDNPALLAELLGMALAPGYEVRGPSGVIEGCLVFVALPARLYAFTPEERE